METIQLILAVTDKYRILGKRLLISCLTGKASRTLLEAEPGKLDIKRLEPGVLFSSVNKLVYSSNLLLWRNYRFPCRFNDVIQKVQRHLDLIKTHAVR